MSKTDHPTETSTTELTLPYEAPNFERHALALITLGGSVGSGDSGAAQAVFGQSSPGWDEESEEEDDWSSDRGGW